jgi:DNA repair protein RadC
VKKDKTGHRERLREGFLTGDPKSLTEEALLELLLTYAIPQKDLKPLAQRLLRKFQSLSKVLAEELTTLCETEGIKSYSATLLKLVDRIRTNYPSGSHLETPRIYDCKQQDLFTDIPFELKHRKQLEKANKGISTGQIDRHAETHLFGKSVLKEAIALLPSLPDSESLDEIRSFLRTKLHFSAVQTRQRYANYITRRMFPEGYADAPLRLD